MAGDLWASADCAAWQSTLDSYPAVIAAQDVNGLEELDRWYREELPVLLAGRNRPYISRDELVRVTSWKMKRGVWRERNRQLVLGNDPLLVEVMSTDAFGAMPDPRRPVAILVALAGVGPATASAVLAAYRPDLFPFFDDLVAAQIPGLGPVSFTAAFYARYAERLREKAAQLTGDCAPTAWTAQMVSQALWAASGGKAALPS